MARRALLVGINDYKKIGDLRGCLNDVSNMRNILKTYLGFGNSDIRVLTESRATRENIIHRLKWLVRATKPGDFMVFHFSGHGSQIRDRNGDELEDGMDELICPWDHDWDGCFILDDDLDDIFSGLPENSLLEVFLDCCHSGDGIRTMPRSADHTPRDTSKSRYLEPPQDIRFRHEGEEEDLKVRGFRSGNRSGGRSTKHHILWSGCRSDQTSADAEIDGTVNGAFTYYLCKHMRKTGGHISRRNLIERVRNSLRHNAYPQIPQLACGNKADYENNPLQLPVPEERERQLFLTTPYMRGDDVKSVQRALVKKEFKTSVDGVFGPQTQHAVRQFQNQNQLVVDGVVGKTVRAALFS
ncbi:caspase family protein [Desulfobacterales bacterium HSG2]|nr:caspase family protein [Desulfobacterales bacterium HSG2]